MRPLDHRKPYLKNAISLISPSFPQIHLKFLSLAEDRKYHFKLKNWPENVDTFKTVKLLQTDSKYEDLALGVSNQLCQGFSVVLVVKNLPANAGDSRDMGSIPGSERCHGGGHDNPLQYSCLENPMDSGTWRATSMTLQRVGHNYVMEHTHKSIYSCRVLEIRSPKSGFEEGCISSRGSGD